MGVHWYGYRTIAWVGLAALAMAGGLALLQGKIGGAIALAVFLAAGIAFLLLADDLPHLFDALFVAAGLLNAAGFVWNLFNQPGLYDEVAHLFTTFSVTLALGFIVYGYRLIQFRGMHSLIVITITSFGIAIGALWEVAEWTADHFVAATVVVGLDDTIVDLILDSIGALVAALLTLRVVHRRALEDERKEREQSGERLALEQTPGN